MTLTDSFPDDLCELLLRHKKLHHFISIFCSDNFLYSHINTLKKFIEYDQDRIKERRTMLRYPTHCPKSKEELLEHIKRHFTKIKYVGLKYYITHEPNPNWDYIYIQYFKTKFMIVTNII